ncbi:MAG: 4Fe-4S dicluster domain-containing protein [Actinobacteria bacterium]|nr:4Fe-4S dicluster domain-containing protein [Actinomycetota bacterium]
MELREKLALVRFNVDGESHLKILDDNICLNLCEDKPCSGVCPAGVYEWLGTRMAIGYEGCLECGSCRVVCPFGNIDWRWPRGGFGLSYKNG